MDLFAVHLKLLDISDCNFRYDIATEVPHLSDFTGQMTIAPRHLLLRFTPDSEGSWELYMVSVFGMPVVNGNVKERKRLDNVLFLRPLDEDGGTPGLPDWLREIAEHHVHLMNPEDLRERQDEAAREVAHEMFAGLMPGSTGANMADEIAAKILAAVRWVG